MAFENLTLFELHLENARIGPNAGEDDEDADVAVESESSGGGRRRRRPAVALLLLAIGVAVAARRYRRHETAPDEGEQVTIEHAAEQ